ncbi:hypothetical protein AB0O76_26510 [Streptomyces sp. NPDC086554]|uniref:hypothetical protein n=1 Tax=Streptomyces sp. NPDC086554 TaxID=3154864 RepID=UPI0034333222
MTTAVLLNVRHDLATPADQHPMMAVCDQELDEMPLPTAKAIEIAALVPHPGRSRTPHLGPRELPGQIEELTAFLVEQADTPVARTGSPVGVRLVPTWSAELDAEVVPPSYHTPRPERARRTRLPVLTTKRPAAEVH